MIVKSNQPHHSADEWAEPTWDIAHLFPAQGTWSVEEYLGLETNRLIEFSHGRIEVLPMPSDKHQSIVAYLYGILFTYARQFGGKVLFSPLRLQLWPNKFREPDLVFLAAADDPRRQQQFWTGADLVVEVVSPDDRRRDLVTKRFEYARAGIPEYWIVDPQTEAMTVLTPGEDGYVVHGYFGRGEVATSRHFQGLVAEVDAVLDAP